MDRRVRMRELSTEHALRALAAFEELLRSSFQVVLPQKADFDLAIAFVQYTETGLRSGDALHLAIAHNRGVRRFYTLDKKLIKAAKLLGIVGTSGE
jgi:predicted nucleic acid-binding protein